MTEWHAADYDFKGAERILDVGCGNGKITAKIAARVPDGSVLGVDPSHAMIEFASSHYDAARYPNLRFEIADARSLPYREEFDVVVSFNALRWIRQQDEALRSICAAMKPGARAQPRLVCKGERRSLEHVLEATCFSPRWAQYYQGFQQPYLHLTPKQYNALAERCGLKMIHIDTEGKCWDFQSRSAFEAFGEVTFVEWTRLLPAQEELNFGGDVFDGYRLVACERPDEKNTFKFYQMNVSLRR